MKKTVNVNFIKGSNSIFWGIVLILAAVFLVLGGLDISLGYGFTTWNIILGVLCAAWFFSRLIKGKFAQTIFPLAFLFLIFEPTIAHALGKTDENLISNWTVILAALLLTIGLSAILPKKNGGKKFIEIGSKTIMLDGADLSDAVISENVGTSQVYITNPELYEGGGTIHINENVGKIKLFLPKNWHVIVNESENLGSVNIVEQEDGVYDKTITLDISENVGSITVVFG
ncbi:MAG: hypothetical protein IKN38_00850 [Clostridia bacterium]|nr:hypothetical protein [Clostridia bacterium]